MVLVVGTIGLDQIETPDGSRHSCLGGSAVHFAYAASLFGPVKMVSVVGQDFPDSYITELNERGVETEGVAVLPGRTFRWACKYFEDMDRRETLKTELNVLSQWSPEIPPAWRDERKVFLANLSPQLQLRALEQLSQPDLVVADTIELWIKTEREELERLIRSIHGFVINESEAMLITGENSPLRAGRSLLESNLRFVVIKKGGHGSVLFTHEGIFPFPAYPVFRVYDPTGAGDSFAGGLVGFLQTCESVDTASLKRAIAYATCIASFNVEDFGTSRIAKLSREELEKRVSDFRMILSL